MIPTFSVYGFVDGKRVTSVRAFTIVPSYDEATALAHAPTQPEY